MAVGGTLVLSGFRLMMSWLLARLITLAAPPYQAAVGVITRAVTNGLFTLTTWILVGGLIVAAVTLLSGPYPWAAAIRRTIRDGRGAGPGRVGG